VGVLQKLAMQGSVTRGPVLPTSTPATIGGDEIPIDLSAVYAEHRREPRTINSPSTFVDLIAGMTISAVRFVIIRTTGGVATLRLTTPAGEDQLLSISDLFILSNPVSGSEVSALAIKGSVNIEVLISGDT